MLKKLDKMINPKSIAIIGASAKQDSVGFKLLNNVISGGYKGAIYAVNPKYTEILGIKCYNTIANLPEIPDLSIIAIPATSVFDNIVQSANFGVQNFYIISSGFGEMGEQGKETEKKISTFATENNLNIIGPNTIGMLNNNLNLNCNFSESKCTDGKAVLISQSGALASGIMNIFNTTQIGLKYCISLGNQCDVDFSDLIEYFSSQKNIEIIVLYMETIKNPQKMREVCARSNKKIICIKSGTSPKGAEAASSHTGALASSDVITDAFLRQCGIVRVQSIDELIAVASLFSLTKFNKNIESVAVITNAGGPAIMTVDSLSKHNINLYEFTDSEKMQMKNYLQKQASIKNPIDMVASASIEDYRNTLELCLNNEKIDAIICIHLFIMGTQSQQIAQILDEYKQKYPNKCMLGIFVTTATAFNEIKQKTKNLPVYDSTELAVLALSKMNMPKSNLNTKSKPINNAQIDRLLSVARDENRLLTTYESLNVMKELKLPVVKFEFAKNIDDACKLANKIGYPLVIKITSKTITHKSDVGGVRTNIKNVDELKIAFNEIIANLNSKGIADQIDGIIVQEMKLCKREFVYGVNKDKNYGLCSMFGLGGIFVEAFKDVSFKVLPTSNDDIKEQINSLNSSKLLGCIRNLPKANIDSLVNIIQCINDMALTFNINELDLNPLLIDDVTGDISLIDARIKP